jgi:ABC-type uncharacterized transport system substrate-binding protein
VRRIGVLMAYSESDREGQANVAAFREGLQKLGWTDGRNLRIDSRWAALDAEAMQRFAKEIVALQPELVLSSSTPTTAALLQETRTIPIIFASIVDPVGSGFIVNLSRPGGNAHTPNSGLILMPDAFMIDHSEEITLLAARYRLPAVYPFRFITELGGLLSYGNNRLDNYRSVATYADRILKGAKPSDLPVQAPVKFELVINLKTAKSLGLDVPLQLQQRADEVIE